MNTRRCDRPVTRCVLEHGHAGHCSIEADTDCYLFWDAGELLEPDERKEIECYRKQAKDIEDYPQWPDEAIRYLLAIIDRLAPKPEERHG